MRTTRLHAQIQETALSPGNGATARLIEMNHISINILIKSVKRKDAQFLTTLLASNAQLLFLRQFPLWCR